MGKSKTREKKSKKSKKKHKHKDHKEKRSMKDMKHHKKKKHDKSKVGEEDGDNFEIPVDLMNSKSHAPETPEEYQERQNQIRRDTDPVTGRSRLIKGDGEVLEEIVSKERHAKINKSATLSDGAFFQEKTLSAAVKQKQK